MKIDDRVKLECENNELRKALEESLSLQSHYAKSLNMYDGGHRIGFASVDAWIKRLKICAKLNKKAGKERGK